MKTLNRFFAYLSLPVLGAGLVNCSSSPIEVWDLSEETIPEYVTVDKARDVEVGGIVMYYYSITSPKNLDRSEFELVSKQLINETRPHHHVSVLLYRSESEAKKGGIPSAEARWEPGFIVRNGFNEYQPPAKGDYSNHQLTVRIDSSKN
ncbi:MAG: hypothetical protein AAF558_12675 [Verrucomicrobiota bacterium]